LKIVIVHSKGQPIAAPQLPDHVNSTVSSSLCELGRERSDVDVLVRGDVHQVRRNVFVAWGMFGRGELDLVREGPHLLAKPLRACLCEVDKSWATAARASPSQRRISRRLAKIVKTRLRPPWERLVRQTRQITKRCHWPQCTVEKGSWCFDGECRWRMVCMEGEVKGKRDGARYIRRRWRREGGGSDMCVECCPLHSECLVFGVLGLICRI
jgi:hypothetical protein